MLQSNIVSIIGQFQMNNIISLQRVGNFLQVEQNKIIHISINQQKEQAKDILEGLLKINKYKNALHAQLDDNVSKITVNHVALFSLFNSSDDYFKIQLIKTLLVRIQEMLACPNPQAALTPDSIMEQGFFYYQSSIQDIQYYQFISRNSQMKQNKYTAIELAGIFLHLLFYSKDVKQYLKRWKKISINKQKFLLDQSNLDKTNKIDQFIRSIFSNEVNTIKMGMYSLEIIKQKLDWVKGISQKQKGQRNSTNYADIKLQLNSKSKQSKIEGRLKQSNSMSNLSSSSNKNRKYKKLNQNHRQKLFKPDNSKLKTSQSFYNPSFNMKTISNASLFRDNLAEIEKSLYNNRFGQDKIRRNQQILQSFSKVNEEMMEKCNISQSELMKILQKKQKSRKCAGKNARQNSKQNNKQNKQVIKNQGIDKYKISLDNIIQTEKPKQNKLTMFRALELGIKGQKMTKKLKHISTLYSINEKLASPTSSHIHTVPSKSQTQKNTFKPNYKQKEQDSIQSISVVDKPNKSNKPDKPDKLDKPKLDKPSQKQHKKYEQLDQQKTSNSTPKELNSAHKIEDSVEKQINYYDLNLKFVCQTIQIFYKQVNLRSFLLLPLYAIYVFYFSHLYRNKCKRDDHQNTHLTNIEKVGSLISKQLAKSQYIKNLSKQTLSSIEFLLKIPKSSEITLAQALQPTLKVLKTQFQHNKTQFIKRKSQLMKNNTFKILVICFLRHAIAISIIKNCQKRNHVVDDFSRYEGVILKKPECQIDLMSELRNYQQIFQ